MIEMYNVNSSNVVAVGWDKGNLYVEYRRGSYMYKNVPKAKYNELMNAESKGKFMCSKIKGIYDYERIE